MLNNYPTVKALSHRRSDGNRQIKLLENLFYLCIKSAFTACSCSPVNAGCCCEVFFVRMNDRERSVDVVFVVVAVIA